MRTYILLICLIFSNCLSMQEEKPFLDPEDGTLEMLPHPPPYDCESRLARLRKLPPKWQLPVGILLCLTGATALSLDAYTALISNHEHNNLTVLTSKIVTNSITLISGLIMSTVGSSAYCSWDPGPGLM